MLSKEVSVTMVQMRKRSLGNIRFIGELFKLKMLSESIMKECITRLLRSTSDEEALECFGKLIMTTGKDLDRPEAKVGVALCEGVGLMCLVCFAETHGCVFCSYSGYYQEGENPCSH